MLEIILYVLLLPAFGSDDKIPEHKCPADSTLIMNDAIAICCVRSSVEQKVGYLPGYCIRSGEEAAYYKASGESKFRKSYSRFYEKNILNGPFREWWQDSGDPKIVGEYEKGKLIGEWKVFGEKSVDPFVLDYTNGILNSVTLPDKKKHSVQNIKTAIANKRYIGGMRPVGEQHIRSQESDQWEFRFFYSDFKKTSVIGIAIGEFRFFSDKVLRGKDEEYGFSRWEVRNKREGMCQIDLWDSFPWVECIDYEDIVDEMNNHAGNLQVSKFEIFYEFPGRKAYRPDFIFDPVKMRVKGDFSIKVKSVIKSKLYNGEIWVQLELGYEDVDLDEINLHDLQESAGVPVADIDEPNEGVESDSPMVEEAIWKKRNEKILLLKRELLDKIREKIDKKDIKENFNPWIPLYDKDSKSRVSSYIC